MAFDATRLSPKMQRVYAAYVAKYPNTQPTSGHRSHSHNASVGGAKNSKHLTGDAVDFGAEGLTEEEKAERVAYWHSLVGEGSGGVGDYGNSLHFDVGSRRAWGPDFTRNTAPEYLLGQSPRPGALTGDHRDHGGHEDPNLVAKKPAPYQRMERHASGGWGDTPDGYLRVPGTGHALNKNALSTSLSAFGNAYGGGAQW